MKHKFLYGVAIALLLQAVSICAAASDKVVLATNWRAKAPHGGFYQAVVDGTYERFGLNVEIVQGGNQINYKPLLLAGRIDFLLTANLLTVFDNYKNRAPTIVVAAIFQKDPLAFIAHPGQGYEEFSRLKNAPKIFVSKDTQFLAWKWLEKVHGFRDKSMRNYNYNLSPFIADKKSIQQGYSIAEPIAIEQQAGFKPVVHLLADHGFSTYSTLLETRESLVQQKPDLVSRFVDASIIGWANYLYGDRAAANTLLIRENPELNFLEIEQSVALMKSQGIVNSGEATEFGIGAMNPSRVADFYKTMVEVGLYNSNDVDLSKVIRYDFVNKGVALDITHSKHLNE